MMDCDHPQGFRRTAGCVACERDELAESVTEMTHNAERRQVELDAARVTELEAVERSRRIQVSWIDDVDDDDAGHETGWIRAVEGDQAVIDCDCGPRIVRRPLAALTLQRTR